MKKEKIVDFSNIFSSKSQSLIAKHQLFKTQKLSPLSFIPLSPFAKSKPEYITNLPKVQDFKSMDKIKLSQEKIKNIMQSLQLQAKAENRFEQRTKTNQLYLSFHENPFTREFNQTQRIDYEQQENISSIDIVSEMTNLHHIDLESHLRKQVPPLESDIKNFYHRLKKRIEKDRKKAYEINKENINPSKDTDERNAAYNSDQIAGLDAIVNAKDQPFFKNYYKQADRNIFQLINNKSHSYFRSNREIFERYYFCVDSMIGAVVTKQKKNKLYINHVESFSTFTRDLARNIIPKKIPEKMIMSKGDILLNLQELKFQEIMNVCNNKLTSRALLEYFRQEEIDSKKKGEDEQDSSLANQPLISQDKNCKNRMDNHNPINQDKAEIDYYHKSSLSNIEVRQKQLSNIYFMKLKKVIQQEADVISKSIRDKKVLNQFKKKKDTILTEILQTNVDDRLNHFKEVERNIRMNKVNKNRTEKIKIDTLTKSFQIKKELETSINKSLNKKERKYSPMNTWRG